MNEISPCIAFELAPVFIALIPSIIGMRMNWRGLVLAPFDPFRIPVINSGLFDLSDSVKDDVLLCSGFHDTLRVVCHEHDCSLKRWLVRPPS